MSQVHPVGIDVSARTLQVALSLSSEEIKQATFNNDQKGHRALLRWLTKRGRQVRVCLEATGLYSLPVALALHQHRRAQVAVVNPKAIAHYGQAHLQRAKTDPIDARLILDFAQRMPFVPFQPPSQDVMQLQALTRRINQLNGEITRERNRLHAQAYRPEKENLIAQDIKVNIRHLKRRIKRIQDQACAIVSKNQTLKRHFKRLISIPGIAQISALRILAELSVLPKDMTPPQWVAHAGLDPVPKQSGTSINRPRRISKGGNKYLRAALYMPALVAIRHHQNVKAFYDKLIARGKKPLQAIVAVMRKLLHAIWGVWTYDQDFDGQKFYKLTA